MSKMKEEICTIQEKLILNQQEIIDTQRKIIENINKNYQSLEKLLFSIIKTSGKNEFGIIYLILSHNGKCKIGWSSNIKRRMKTYKQHVKKQKIFQEFPVPQSFEFSLHKNFRNKFQNNKEKHVNEWYSIKFDILEKCIQFELNQYHIKKSTIRNFRTVVNYPEIPEPSKSSSTIANSLSPTTDEACSLLTSCHDIITPCSELDAPRLNSSISTEIPEPIFWPLKKEK